MQNNRLNIIDDISVGFSIPGWQCDRPARAASWASKPQRQPGRDGAAAAEGTSAHHTRTWAQARLRHCEEGGGGSPARGKHAGLPAAAGHAPGPRGPGPRGPRLEQQVRGGLPAALRRRPVRQRPALPEDGAGRLWLLPRLRGRRGHTCYRTVVGMDGVKCGPGLRCQFHSEEDAFGDEYGVCRDCPFGTFGMDCRETCRCPLGVCDRVTGRCLPFPFSSAQPPGPPTEALPAQVSRAVDTGGRQLVLHAWGVMAVPYCAGGRPDAGSGDGNAVTQDLRSQHAARSPGTKWLEPR
ncbi:hypothetical protein QTO34_014112 [Cnephaeus nilssonii]|uniref:Uncharacterized protein n=1 Tax=Cnephaeus nilssonii TaxID=3371016 RepID=A0AA40I9D8_CNENI|nr:hypothetical protein QTO34_014112 [Eptesicus nilssonii]